MANALYDKGRQKFLEGSIAILTDNIKVAAIYVTNYTVNLSTDEFYSTISGTAIIATSGNLASKTSTGGVFNAANITFTAVTGNTIGALVVWKDTGSAATSPLLAYIDTGTGLPVTPNGGDITVTWDTGSNKIFKL